MHSNPLRTATAGLCLAALLLVGCGSEKSTSSSSDTTAKPKETTTTTAPSLMIEDVWARKSPAGTSMGAAYLNITSPIDDRLMSASVPAAVAKKTELHETVGDMGGGDMGGDMTTTTGMGGDMTTTTGMGGDMTTTTGMGGDDKTTTTMGGGSMTMRPVKAIELPAGKTVMLKPGGYHIMLIDLVQPLAVGDRIEITLTFEKAGKKTVEAEVRDA